MTSGVARPGQERNLSCGWGSTPCPCDCDRDRDGDCTRSTQCRAGHRFLMSWSRLLARGSFIFRGRSCCRCLSDYHKGHRPHHAFSSHCHHQKHRIQIDHANDDLSVIAIVVTIRYSFEHTPCSFDTQSDTTGRRSFTRDTDFPRLHNAHLPPTPLSQTAPRQSSQIPKHIAH